MGVGPSEGLHYGSTALHGIPREAESNPKALPYPPTGHIPMITPQCQQSLGAGRAGEGLLGASARRVGYVV